MTGRPTKLTPETHRLIVDALEIGATRKDAAGAAGVTYETFLNWMKRGEESKRGRFFDFFNAASRAECKARLSYLKVIKRASDTGDWRAALEVLKRRDRENWGDGVDITSGDEPLVIKVGVMSAE